MSSVGRPRAPVWRLFDRDDSNKLNVKAVCKGCKGSMQGVTKRMSKHVESCKLLKQFVSNDDVSVKPSVIKRSFDSAFHDSDSNLDSPMKKFKQGNHVVIFTYCVI